MGTAQPTENTERPITSSVVVVALSDVALQALDDIKRSFETDAEAINRILETLAASAPDFDHFYGEPRDRRGPSGT